MVPLFLFAGAGQLGEIEIERDIGQLFLAPGCKLILRGLPIAGFREPTLLDTIFEVCRPQRQWVYGAISS